MSHSRKDAVGGHKAHFLKDEGYNGGTLFQAKGRRWVKRHGWKRHRIAIKAMEAEALRDYYYDLKEDQAELMRLDEEAAEYDYYHNEIYDSYETEFKLEKNYEFEEYPMWGYEEVAYDWDTYYN